MTVADKANDKARAFGRWLVTRSPLAYLLAGWAVAILGCYPGYMSFNSTMQLFDVRNGVYTDTHAPLMTGVWSLLEYVTAGPFPMLVLQTGLFLFGLAAILRTQLSERAASVTAVAILLFPPVFCVMAVIWRESLMTGALLAATGAMLQTGWRSRVAAGALFILACSCQPVAAFAILPLALLAVRDVRWWQRAGIAIAIALVASGAARLVDSVLTDKETYVTQQSREVIDVFGTLRRARVVDPVRIRELLPGLRLADADTLRERMSYRGATLDWWPLAHAPRNVMEPVGTASESDALSTAWRRVVTTYPRDYVRHRWLVTKNLLGLGTGGWSPIYDGFGDPELMGPLHHRATTSDWEVGMQAFVRLFEGTPLFKPWLYVLLAIGLAIAARRRTLVVLLAVSGLLYELALFVYAPAAEYRLSHWLVTTTTVALAAILVARRATWRRDG